MAESLDKVLQPDGTYKWQLVDLTDAYVGRGPSAPAEPAQPPKPKRRTKAEETIPQTAEYEF